jgi:hypothetical protein
MAGPIRKKKSIFEPRSAKMPRSKRKAASIDSNNVGSEELRAADDLETKRSSARAHG